MAKLSGIAKPIRRDMTDNPERVVASIFDFMEDVRDILNRIPFLVRDGNLWKGTLANGNNIISHGLGRKPRGYLIERATGAAPALYEVSRDDKSITLNSSGTPYVELWFF